MIKDDGNLPFLNNELSGPTDEDWNSLDSAFQEIFKVGVDSHATQERIIEKPVVGVSVVKKLSTLEDEREGLDKSVLGIFLEEAEDQVKALKKEWEILGPKESVLPSDFMSFKRLIHTFKGNAGMVGAFGLHDLAHEMETEITDLEEGRLDWEDCKLGVQLGIQDMVEWVMWIQTEEYNPTFSRKLGDGLAIVIPKKLSVSSSIETNDSKSGKVAAVEIDAMIRLKAKNIDALLQDVGVWGSGQSALKSQNIALKNTIKDFENSVERMQKLLKEVEISAEAQISARKTEIGESGEKFDPLEMDRFTRLQEATRIMAESVADLSGLQTDFNFVAKNTEDVLQQQSRGVRSAQELLTEARLVPLDAISGKLRKVVALASKETGKSARLEITGDEVRLDRSVLEKLVGPLEHLLRNAVSHGLEGSDFRKEIGKDVVGNISIEAVHKENTIVIMCKDDGQGINTGRVLSKARERGWINDEKSLTDDEIYNFIFKPGFSTAESITGLSGRGVGMDVVKTEVELLGGRLTIESKAGKGTAFYLEVPLTIATTQALVVKAGDEEWALPAQHVKQVHAIKHDELALAYKEKNWKGAPMVYLLDLLNPKRVDPNIESYNTVIEFLQGGKSLYIHVDSLISTDDVVIRPLAKPLSLVSGLGGTAYLGEGRMGLLLQPFALFERKMRVSGSEKAKIGSAVKDIGIKKITAMVVDDSLTVRKVTGDLLRSKGFGVILAKDGVDALEKLQNEMPEIMLVDLEMPRMNGFELVEHLRNTPKFAHLPIVMITSRTAEKHQEVARKLGVNAYLGKPYQETELLDQISKWTAQKSA